MIAYSNTDCPDCQTLLPAREMFIDTLSLELIDFNRSAMRPAHPTAERVSGNDVCHCSIWSECENNPSGNGTDPF